MASVAIITARGGSKRIPGKNIRLFRGKPIIAYAIEAAVRSGLFGEVMVSTDSDEIAAIAVQYGAVVPFKRSADNANDMAGTLPVILEVLEEYEKQLGRKFESGCCIYPTACFVTPALLTKAYQLMKERSFGTVFPVIRFGYPIQRGLIVDGNGSVKMKWPENLEMRSQDLETIYHDAGQFYWFDSDVIVRENKLFGSKSGSIIIDELSAQDIDNETDWKIAEIKHAILFPGT